MAEQVSQARAKDRQKRILDAALSVFSRHGYRDASVDEIAVEAETSKGGVYFHFPGKQLHLPCTLDYGVEAPAGPRRRGDCARERARSPGLMRRLLTALRTFAEHKSMARLFMLEALGAGSEFQERLMEMHDEFIAVIRLHLDEAVAQGVVPPIDTAIASRAWFGALNEVILQWLIKGEPERLEDAYDSLRPLLMRSVGVEV